MRKIKLLDCTLRDGGYVNEWNFGRSVISKISNKMIQAGVDVVELGYLSTKNVGNPSLARFDSVADVRRAYARSKGEEQSYAVMINYGEYCDDLLPVAEESAPIIRVAFHKKDLDGAFFLFEQLEAKGYHYFIQPMGAQNYSDEEYVHLIKRASGLKPDGFYIVDSFGVMELKNFRRLLFLADNNLREGILLGYHSHNNLQQAYSNSKYMVEQSLEHDIIIDASVFGMGRGAGNLNIELFAEYLNMNYDKTYSIEPILEVFDECLKPIFIKNFWGYSLPFYLSSIHNCHPNYASFFAEKNTLSVKSMHEILSSISDEDKSSFSKDKAAAYYLKYQQRFVDDHDALEQIKQTVGDKPVLILAPGKSISDFAEKICEFIETNSPVVIGINRVSKEYTYDYLFITNERRVMTDKLENVLEYIITSNLKGRVENAVCVSYSSYLCSDERSADNPTLMMFNLLFSIGIRKVYIAGFDGFSTNQEDNYFESGMSMGSKIETKIMKNAATAEQVAKMRGKMDIVFLTPSRYVNDVFAGRGNSSGGIWDEAN